MTATLSTIIPAASALAGVLLAQLWNAWQEKSGHEREVSKLLWSERRGSIFKFLKALNIAKDETRAILFAGLPAGELKVKDRESERYWSEAFESYLEVSLLLPGYPERLAWCTLQDAYIWRRKSVREGESAGSTESHYESLVEQMRPWLEITAKQKRLNKLANSTPLMLGLADRLDVIGYELAVLGDYRASSYNTKEAIELRRRLAERSPANMVALIRSLDTLGTDFVNLGRDQEAITTWCEAISLIKDMAHGQVAEFGNANYQDLQDRLNELTVKSVQG
jgi:hypothetical protein